MTLVPIAMRARGVNRTYRDGPRTVTALEGTDIDILDGKFVSIVGPSACGRSTLLNLFCGLDKPDAGFDPRRRRSVTASCFWTCGIHAPAGYVDALADSY